MSTPEISDKGQRQLRLSPWSFLSTDEKGNEDEGVFYALTYDEAAKDAYLWAKRAGVAITPAED